MNSDGRGVGGAGWAVRVMRWPAVGRYGLAAALTGASAGLQVACEAVLGEASLFVPFYFVALLLSAVYLGLGPGMLAVVLGTVAALFTLPPEGVLKIANPADVAVVMLFAG